MSVAAPRYRPNAGALIFNREKKVLCGHRVDIKGAWQPPQGGIDEGENPVQGAAREMYEEMGLKATEHVKEVKLLDETISYEVPPGTWLEKKGYIGQRMHWMLYFYAGEGLPPVDLSGLGGEKPEFTEVMFMTWEELLQSKLGFKRPLFERLQQIAEPEIEQYVASV
eukprot:CAMPEP_0181294136 /NCGR_PEP_ID=MMETSP1101-20121128/3434_1 /TAXON_ID=46948 /ORGANISM="Rhodomonas abbreviata, Strain Caron Lab Isolate" /LENGTH=166 /DNA_ID=CAMNT_0023398763 /DNA_START=41 /DNA_END=541 /DNA_ORIENTATION=+